MEGDAKKDDDPNDYTDISIHSLRMEGDQSDWRCSNRSG